MWMDEKFSQNWNLDEWLKTKILSKSYENVESAFNNRAWRRLDWFNDIFALNHRAEIDRREGENWKEGLGSLDSLIN